MNHRRSNSTTRRKKVSDITVDDQPVDVDGIGDVDETYYHRSVALLLSALIGIVALIYLINRFVQAAQSPDSIYAIGSMIALGMARPFLICYGLGSVAALYAWFVNGKVAAMASLILFFISLIMLPAYYLFAIPSILLSACGIVSLLRQGY